MDNQRRHDDQTTAKVARVAIDSQVIFSQRVVGGRTTSIAHHPAIGKFFQFGPEEHRIASLLDGTRSLTEILPILQADGITWDATEVAEFISKLVANRLASTSEASEASEAAPQRQDNPAREPQSSGPNAWARNLPRLLSLMISQRIPLFNGHGIASRLERPIGVVFSSVGLLYWCGLVLSGMMIVGAHRQDFAAELRRMFEPGIWLALLLIWVMAKIVHEAGHAIAARYHGVHVGKIGIMFFFLAPLAYVDVTDAWKLKSRWSRVQIALAGVYLELAVAAIAAWAWWLLPEGLPRHLAAQVILIAGPATLFVNANPLLRLDGYYVLSDLTEIPNLRMHGRNQLVAAIERALLGMEAARPLLSGWRRSFATAHALCSVIFQIVWMAGLIIGVSIWAKGLGMLLAMAALVLWLLLPLSHWVRKVWMCDPAERWFLNDKRKRLLGYASLLLMFLQYLYATNSPFARRVPVVVQFHDQQIARASADAFVRGVYVTRGQRVKKGMLLVELEDPELLLRRDQRADDIEIAELRAVQFRRQGELAKSAAEFENAESLRRQLTELDEQIAGLRVTAERDGLIVSPAIDSLQGRFVGRGEELLSVSDPQEKELLASVSENDMQAYQIAAAHGEPSLVRLRGGKTFDAIPASLRPRARRTLAHPALAATVGGPLPVEPSPNPDEPLRVVQPQLESHTALDPVTSIEIQAGQIGTMTISDNRSLITRWFKAMTR